MSILRTYKEAIRVADRYSTDESLATTLNYIFDTKYTCYMLCVQNQIPTLYKLESKSGNPILDKQINKTLRQRKIKTKTKTWRIMGCIIKPFKKESSFAREWVRFLDSVKDRLPNGVFILSLSDSVLLPDTVEGNFAKVYAYSGKRGYLDIPIPTYDDIFDREMEGMQTVWEQKKPIAVFRGSSTGCGTKPDTNQRLKLATMKSDDLDVGITQYTSHLKYTSPNDVGKIEKLVPTVPKLDWKQQSEYKYILHVDGNVVAYRLLKSMLTNSVILRVKSEFIHWCDNELKPGVHYIEIKDDLSDLREKLDWCKSHDAECKQIADAGYAFATRMLVDETVKSEFIKRL